MTNNLLHTKLQLTQEQFAFLQAQHEEIEHGIIASKLGNASTHHLIEQSAEYRQLFGTMSWDDALDRYEETPGYSDSLRRELHERLQADLTAGKVQLHLPVTLHYKEISLSDDELTQLGLRQLDE